MSNHTDPSRKNADCLTTSRALAKAQALDHAHRHLVQVERVEVQPGRAQLDEALAQLDAFADANFPDAVVVILDGVEGSLKLSREAALAKRRHAIEATIVADAHDARQDGHVDAGRAAVLDEDAVDLCLKNHLRDDDVSAGVDLALEVCNLLGIILVGADEHALGEGNKARELARRELLDIGNGLDHRDVALGVASNSDAEEITIVLADVGNKIKRALEAALARGPLLARRRITAERKDVADVAGLGALEGDVQLGPLHVGAGEMHIGLQMVAVLHLQAQVKREIGCGSTRSPGHVGKERPKLLESIEAGLEVLHAIVGLGREELH
eukprot:m.222013 g.222013  ORF g.222013 m.222013 type:complete len:326 (-) comp10693_c0_seq1:116-1093(-)